MFLIGVLVGAVAAAWFQSARRLRAGRGDAYDRWVYRHLAPWVVPAIAVWAAGVGMGAALVVFVGVSVAWWRWSRPALARQGEEATR